MIWFLPTSHMSMIIYLLLIIIMWCDFCTRFLRTPMQINPACFNSQFLSVVKRYIATIEKKQVHVSNKYMYRRYLVLSCVLWSEHIMPAAYHHYNIIPISKLNQIGLNTFKCSLLVCTVYLLTNCSFRSRKGLTMY